MMIWRFRRLLDAYGADPARWPEEERAAAEALLRRSAAARAALAEARAFDEQLRRNAVPDPDDRLADRIIAHALANAQEHDMSPRPLAGSAGPTKLARAARGVGERDRVRGNFFRFGLWPQLAGLAVAGLLGFVIGAADFDLIGLDQSVDLSDFADFSSDLEDPLS